MGLRAVCHVWGHWSCDPQGQSRRRRCSLLVERLGDGGTTRVLIDTSPDMRAQLLDAGVGALDGVVYTHSHADHVHGLDDLRMIVFNMKTRLNVWADAATAGDLLSRFGYAFIQPEGSDYPPILTLNPIKGDVVVSGEGGDITLRPFDVQHGRITAKGFRVGDVAYLPDVSDIPARAWEMLAGLDVWILDALRRTPHSSHAHLAQSLDWIARARPRRAILTNMHIDLDYQTLCDELPADIAPAYDGLSVTVDV